MLARRNSSGRVWIGLTVVLLGVALAVWIGRPSVESSAGVVERSGPHEEPAPRSIPSPP